jgi:hypothetical protein
MTFSFSKAVRRRVPLLVSFDGVSGSGKTYSSLLLAAGMVAPGGKVALLDTENRRGEMYADEPGITKHFPDGYEYAEMKPPYSPQRYIEAIDDAEKAGITCLVIDSGSHEWEGYGGCSDIAEQFKIKGGPNWMKGKLEHKKFMNRLLSSSMDIITCLRAREKVKVVKGENGKEQFVQQGIMPICEKNFVFEMTLSVMIEEASHLPIVRKVPAPLAHLFPENLKLITKDIGTHVRQWAESGSRVAKGELSLDDLKTQAVFSASEGMSVYQSFWGTLTTSQKNALKPFHEENKRLAQQADSGGAEKAKRFAEFRGRMEKADNPETLSKIHADMVEAYEAGDITEEQHGSLDQLAQAKLDALPSLV